MEPIMKVEEAIQISTSLGEYAKQRKLSLKVTHKKSPMHLRRAFFIESPSKIHQGKASPCKFIHQINSDSASPSNYVMPMNRTPMKASQARSNSRNGMRKSLSCNRIQNIKTNRHTMPEDMSSVNQADEQHFKQQQRINLPAARTFNITNLPRNLQTQSMKHIKQIFSITTKSSFKQKVPTTIRVKEFLFHFNCRNEQNKAEIWKNNDINSNLALVELSRLYKMEALSVSHILTQYYVSIYSAPPGNFEESIKCAKNNKINEIKLRDAIFKGLIRHPMLRRVCDAIGILECTVLNPIAEKLYCFEDFIHFYMYGDTKLMNSQDKYQFVIKYLFPNNQQFISQKEFISCISITTQDDKETKCASLKKFKRYITNDTRLIYVHKLKRELINDVTYTSMLLKSILKQ